MGHIIQQTAKISSNNRSSDLFPSRPPPNNSTISRQPASIPNDDGPSACYRRWRCTPCLFKGTTRLLLLLLLLLLLIIPAQTVVLVVVVVVSKSLPHPFLLQPYPSAAAALPTPPLYHHSNLPSSSLEIDSVARVKLISQSGCCSFLVLLAIHVSEPHARKLLYFGEWRDPSKATSTSGGVVSRGTEYWWGSSAPLPLGNGGLCGIIAQPYLRNMRKG